MTWDVCFFLSSPSSNVLFPLSFFPAIIFSWSVLIFSGKHLISSVTLLAWYVLPSALTKFAFSFNLTSIFANLFITSCQSTVLFYFQRSLQRLRSSTLNIPALIFWKLRTFLDFFVDHCSTKTLGTCSRRGQFTSFWEDCQGLLIFYRFRSEARAKSSLLQYYFVHFVRSILEPDRDSTIRKKVLCCSDFFVQYFWNIN